MKKVVISTLALCLLVAAPAAAKPAKRVGWIGPTKVWTVPAVDNDGTQVNCRVRSGKWNSGKVRRTRSGKIQKIVFPFKQLLGCTMASGQTVPLTYVQAPPNTSVAQPSASAGETAPAPSGTETASGKVNPIDPPCVNTEQGCNPNTDPETADASCVYDSSDGTNYACMAEEEARMVKCWDSNGWWYPGSKGTGECYATEQ